MLQFMQVVILTYCTNEACTVIMSKTTNNNTRLERSGLPLFPVHFKMDEIAHLDDLEVAAVNNHIGISTLAITNDRYIVIWQQGNLNIQDPGKIVASGSGSCNSTDLCFNSLKETVRTGMERELKEEGLHQVLNRPFLILLQPK